MMIPIKGYIFNDCLRGDWTDLENDEANYSFEWRETVTPTDDQIRQKALKVLRKESLMKGDCPYVIKFQSRFIPFMYHNNDKFI